MSAESKQRLHTIHAYFYFLLGLTRLFYSEVAMDVDDRESPSDVTSDRCGQLDAHSSSDEDSEGEWPLLLVCKMQPVFSTLPFYF